MILAAEREAAISLLDKKIENSQVIARGVWTCSLCFLLFMDTRAIRVIRG
jgi:hypothetical protein